MVYTNNDLYDKIKHV